MWTPAKFIFANTANSDHDIVVDVARYLAIVKAA
jgi:hypothetical protein